MLKWDGTCGSSASRMCSQLTCHSSNAFQPVGALPHQLIVTFEGNPFRSTPRLSPSNPIPLGTKAGNEIAARSATSTLYVSAGIGTCAVSITFSDSLLLRVCSQTTRRSQSTPFNDTTAQTWRAGDTSVRQRRSSRAAWDQAAGMYSKSGDLRMTGKAGTRTIIPLVSKLAIR
jgi:hypothetical protein